MLGGHRQEVLEELNHLARKYDSTISFVTIEATDAIPDWPTERTPAMFAYRDGTKQKEWIGAGSFLSRGQVEDMLRSWQAL